LRDSRREPSREDKGCELRIAVLEVRAGREARAPQPDSDSDPGDANAVVDILDSTEE